MHVEESESELLKQLIERASKVVAQLETERDELLADAIRMSTEARDAGLAALHRSIETAQRLRQSLLDASESGTETRDGNQP